MSTESILSLAHRVLAGVVLALAAISTAHANEIIIENTGMEKMLREQVFRDEGQYHLIQRTRCQYAALDSPSVTISGGRLFIKSHLSSRLGLETGTGCADAGGDSFFLTVSARPTFQGEMLGLTDIRLDDISKEFYRPFLQGFMQTVIPRLVQINLREGVQRMLASGQTSLDMTVTKLSLTELSAENNRVRAKIAFTLTAK